MNIVERDILSLQRNSIEFNNQKDITGCLVLYDDQFVGILEGEEEKVTQLIYRIKNDPNAIARLKGIKFKDILNIGT